MTDKTITPAMCVAASDAAMERGVILPASHASDIIEAALRAAPSPAPAAPSAAQPAQDTTEAAPYRIRITPDMTDDQINAAAAAEEARVDALTETAKRIAWAVHLHHGVALYDDANDLWSAISVEKKAEWLSAARAAQPVGEVVEALIKAVETMLQAPDIADVPDVDKDPETVDAERQLRKAVAALRSGEVR